MVAFGLVLLVLQMILGTPLGLVLSHYVHDPLHRRIYILILGLGSLYILFGFVAIFQVGLSSSIGFYMAKHLKLPPFYVLIFEIGYLFLFCHVPVQLAQTSWTMEYSAALMVSVAKSSLFSFALTDSRALEESKDPKPRLHEKDHLNSVYMSQRISTNPSYFDFLTYVYFFPAVVAGPAISYAAFEKMLYRDPKSPIDMSRVYEALIYAAIALPITLLSNAYSGPKLFFSPIYENRSYILKLLIAWISTCAFRFKYYFSWKLCEAGCIAAGVPPAQAENVDVYAVETAKNLNEVIAAWNKSVSFWIKYYIFHRMNIPKSWAKALGISHPFLSMLSSRLVGAVWHGLHASFYLFFFNIILVDISERGLITLMGAFSEQKAGIIIRIMYSSFGTAYMGIAWQLLKLKSTWVIWKDLYFIGHIICFSLLAFDLVAGKKKEKAVVSVDKQKTS